MQKKQSFTEKCINTLKEPREILAGVRERLYKRGDVPELGITSLPDFNSLIWGLRPGLTVIGARTSQGKSSFALQIAYDLADQNKEVLYLSLEMTSESLMERLFCNTQEVDNYHLLTGHFKHNTEYQSKWELFSKALNIPLKISSVLGKDLDDINNLIEVLNPKPKVIIVDLVQAINKKGAFNERLVLDDYIIRFRELCILNDIAGVLVSQNSRQVFDNDKKEPSLSNLKGTGCLEEAADSVFLLFWPHFFDAGLDRNLYKIIVAKQRDGRTGEHLVNYLPEYYKFTELSEAQKFKIKAQQTKTAKCPQP